jgi:hypothetical protein
MKLIERISRVIKLIYIPGMNEMKINEEEREDGAALYGRK